MSPSSDKRFQSKEIRLFSAVAKSITLGKTAVFTAVFSLVLFALCSEPQLLGRGREFDFLTERLLQVAARFAGFLLEEKLLY